MLSSNHKLFHCCCPWHSEELNLRIFFKDLDDAKKNETLTLILIFK